MAGSAAAGPGRRRETLVELGLDRLDLILLRPELQGSPPLKARLGGTPALPIGVAEMVVDRRILGHELDRLFEILNRARVIAEPVMRPAQAVDDVAVLGPQLDGLLDHFEATLQILAAVDPGVAEIIEHQRLLRLELERMQEVGLGRLPLARALERDTPAVEQRPALRHARRLKAPDRLVIGTDRFDKALLAAQKIAELHLRTGPCRRLGRHRLELADGV